MTGPDADVNDKMLYLHIFLNIFNLKTIVDEIEEILDNYDEIHNFYAVRLDKLIEARTSHIIENHNQLNKNLLWASEL